MTESNTSIHRETEKILLSHSWILSLDVARFSSVIYHVIRNCHTPFSHRAAHSVHFIDKLIEKKEDLMRIYEHNHRLLRSLSSTLVRIF